jgi:hypothetical protein
MIKAYRWERQAFLATGLRTSFSMTYTFLKQSGIMMASLFLLCMVLSPRIDPPPCREAHEFSTITITAEKESVLLGEPIPLTIKITNYADQPIEFDKWYPRFYVYPDNGKLSFSDLERRLRSLPNERDLAQKEGVIVIGGGRCASATLSPGDSWQESIYLQRYVKQPTVGAYSLDYHVEFPYYIKSLWKDVSGSDISVARTMVGQGRIGFSVHRGSATQLQSIIHNHASLIHTETGYRHEEALRVIQDPVVVPQLVKLLSNCQSYQRMLEALSRFSHQKDAIASVRACLNDNDPQTVVNALSVLTEWKEELKLDEITRLMKSPHSIVREGAANYIRLLKKHFGPVQRI